jgi:hypothetical protein
MPDIQNRSDVPVTGPKGRFVSGLREKPHPPVRHRRNGELSNNFFSRGSGQQRQFFAMFVQPENRFAITINFVHWHSESVIQMNHFANSARQITNDRNQPVSHRFQKA